MSFTRRIIDGARSGLNTVLDRISVDDTPLSHVDEERLQREIEHRTAARQARTARPMDNPRAQIAGASAAARARRKKLADERAARVHAAREQRERAARRAQDDAFRRVQEQARRQASSSARPGSSSTGARPGGSSPFRRQDNQIAEYYKVLDLPYGASLDQVKKSYRQLMRKYHPDRHVGNPKKQKAATELSVRVTQAYKGVEAHLKKSGS